MSKGDLIYKNTLMQELRRMRELPDEVRVKVLAVVSRQPAAEGVPVVHTSWEKKPNGEHGFYEERCKACDLWSLGINKPYCPYCGAKAYRGNADGSGD